MKESGGPVIMVLGLFTLLFLFSESPPKVESIPMPVDGLIEQVEEFTALLPSKTSVILHHVDDASHIPDAGQKVEPSPSDRHEKARREIIIFTRPNCPPCDQWKRCEQARFEADGWVVAYCDQHDFALTPHFSIEKNGKQFDHKGYLPFGKIDEVTQ